ncbi:MAG TPA: hypothetical protein VFE62_16065 [Gemmataceae bacterium]|nr:hypothetical protein [Gemmataceae bacterium]
MYHVYSTLANSTEYLDYGQHNPKGINTIQRSVLIKGGSGINRKHIQTPLGVHTAISDQDYEWLKDNPHFKQHEKNGYMVVKKAESHPEVVAADMVTRQWVKDKTGNVVRGDAFPITPEDFSDKPAGDGLTAIKPAESKPAKKSKTA